MSAEEASAQEAARFSMAADHGVSGRYPMVPQGWKIVVDALLVETHVGMLPHEYGQAQKIVIDASLCYYQPPAEADSEGLIDYDEWCSTVEAYVSTKPHTRLLETLAVEIAMLSFRRWPTLASVTLFLYKPKIRRNAQRLGVELHLRREDAFSRG